MSSGASSEVSLKPSILSARSGVSHPHSKDLHWSHVMPYLRDIMDRGEVQISEISTRLKK